MRAMASLICITAAISLMLFVIVVIYKTSLINTNQYWAKTQYLLNRGE